MRASPVQPVARRSPRGLCTIRLAESALAYEGRFELRALGRHGVAKLRMRFCPFCGKRLEYGAAHCGVLWIRDWLRFSEDRRDKVVPTAPGKYGADVVLEGIAQVA